MNKKPIIHKAGPQRATLYMGLGQYGIFKGPLCAGAKVLYKGKNYQTHRLWEYVTCKKCLKKRGDK